VVGLEFELRALCLAKLALYSLSQSSSPFGSVHFGDGGLTNLAGLEPQSS
jgi:hypothetical protein